MSSSISDIFLTMNSISGATKAFIDYFSEYVYYEYAGKNLDVYCLRPGFVATKINKAFRDKFDVSITPKECVESALRHIGGTK